LPRAYGEELSTAIFEDSDHPHDQKTRRSITGMMIYVGSTPVMAISKRQGCIASSTYCAEFVALRQATEEAIVLRYMLRCLGIPVHSPTMLFCDNKGVTQSANVAHSELKKKHVAISYHLVREAIAAKIINPIWVNSHENWADMCTKPLGKNAFNNLVQAQMFTCTS